MGAEAGRRDKKPGQWRSLEERGRDRDSSAEVDTDGADSDGVDSDGVAWDTIDSDGMDPDQVAGSSDDSNDSRDVLPAQRARSMPYPDAPRAPCRPPSWE